MDFTEQMITIQGTFGKSDRRGKKRIKANVCGPFAYHPTDWTDLAKANGTADDTLTVTHLPTGLALAHKLTEEQAQQFIAKALAVKKIDWECADMAYFTSAPIKYLFLWHLGSLVGRKRMRKPVDD